jgi:hypothetical protein
MTGSAYAAAGAQLPNTAAGSESADQAGTVHYDKSSTKGYSAMPRSTKVEIFTSFEDENEADRERWARMSSEERLQELAVLLERQWGKGWTSKPMERTAWWEKVSWGT